jgi:hypothetical protein
MSLERDHTPDLHLGRVRVAARHVALALTIVLAAMTSGVVDTPLAEGSSFSAKTGDPGSRWTGAAVLLQPYVAQVLADHPYFFYLLDESGGSVATDASGNAHAGTYVNVAGYRQGGAVANNFGYSVALNGNSARIVGGGGALTSPTSYTLELWFKTSSTTGGKLIGFDSTQNSTSPQYDRFIFMQANGQLVYGGWANPTAKTITTPRSYNDNRWHYLALTVTPQGSGQNSTFYVDGVSVAAGQTTKVTSYAGWWQVGFGNLPQGSGYPSDANFHGNIDNVAVYQSALSASRIAAHDVGAN